MPQRELLLEHQRLLPEFSFERRLPKAETLTAFRQQVIEAVAYLVEGFADRLPWRTAHLAEIEDSPTGQLSPDSRREAVAANLAGWLPRDLERLFPEDTEIPLYRVLSRLHLRGHVVANVSPCLTTPNFVRQLRLFQETLESFPYQSASLKKHLAGQDIRVAKLQSSLRLYALPLTGGIAHLDYPTAPAWVDLVTDIDAALLQPTRPHLFTMQRKGLIAAFMSTGNKPFETDPEGNLLGITLNFVLVPPGQQLDIVRTTGAKSAQLILSDEGRADYRRHWAYLKPFLTAVETNDPYQNPFLVLGSGINNDQIRIFTASA